jgi:N-acetylglucosaminyl-diphospho-decaprenol L-rhamnosyltransferase
VARDRRHRARRAGTGGHTIVTEFDIVIVSYNTADLLAGSLTSLRDHRPAGLRRVLVIDNASTDNSAAEARRCWPDVEVTVLDRNAGFAAANNVGLRQSTAPLVLLLNSDTVVPAGSLDRLAARLIATGAAAAGPRLENASGQPEVSFGPMLAPFAELGQSLRVRLAGAGHGLGRWYVSRLLAREREVDWVTGACLLVRRDLAVAAGLIDERYFMYEEDVDFCAALRARGGRIVFTPAATVVHLRGGSRQRASGSSTAIYDRSHVLFYEKHAPAWAGLLRAWLRLRGRGVR